MRSVPPPATTGCFSGRQAGAELWVGAAGFGARRPERPPEFRRGEAEGQGRRLARSTSSPLVRTSTSRVSSITFLTMRPSSGAYMRRVHCGGGFPSTATIWAYTARRQRSTAARRRKTARPWAHGSGVRLPRRNAIGISTTRVFGSSALSVRPEFAHGPPLRIRVTAFSRRRCGRASA